MTQNLTILYRRLYDEYSKRYGETTAVLMLVGKFYEIYDYLDPDSGQPYTSSKKAMELMNIAIKERKNSGPKGETQIWGGVPEQSLHKFARPLTDSGWTVVVVDQVKDPRTDEVVDRTTSRVLSPGTHVEAATDERMTVAALWIDTNAIAASIVDLTTGEVFSYETKQSDEILHMIQVYASKEVIFTQTTSQHDLQTLRSMFGVHGTFHQVPYQRTDNFEQPLAREEYFRTLFRLKTLMPVRPSLGLPTTPFSLVERSLCLLLRFLEDHFPQHTERLSSHTLYEPTTHMRLCNNILEQLSIVTSNGQKSILSLMDKTSSAIGKRALRERILRPITAPDELQQRWDQVGWAIRQEPLKKKLLEKYLKSLYDIPRLHHKLAEGSVQALDVLQLYQSYSATQCLIQNLRKSPLECPADLEMQFSEFRREFKTLLNEEKAQKRVEGEPTGFLTPISGPNTATQEAKIQTIQETWLKQWHGFCAVVKIPLDSFKIEQKGDGEFVWEGPRSYLKQLESQTFLRDRCPLTEFRIEKKKSGPIQLQCMQFTSYTNNLQICINSLDSSLRHELLAVCDSLWDSVKGFQQRWIDWIGAIDSTLALATVAIEQKWCKPSIGNHLHLTGLRHPLIETIQARLEYVKHSVELGGQTPGGWLIYGVNASGKSSLMKATGIAVLLAQAGSYVPADSMALRPYDAAFSRIWTHDNLWAGLSSFAVEVAELRDILSLATARSLVLGDEVCSGTESTSATSLVASTLEHLDSIGSHFMFATHLHDLMKVPGFLPRPGIGVWHLRVQRTADNKLIYERTLQRGPGESTYGLEVARAMGLPLTLLDRAHEIRRALAGETTAQSAPQSRWNSGICRQTCERCKKGIVNTLEVHHITPRCEGGGNELRNLVVLCEQCHDEHHAGAFDIGELRMTSEGPQREISESGTVVTNMTSATKRSKQSKWTEEEEDIITATIQKFGNRWKRIATELGTLGIEITDIQAKRFSLGAS